MLDKVTHDTMANSSDNDALMELIYQKRSKLKLNFIAYLVPLDAIRILIMVFIGSTQFDWHWKITL